MRQNRSCAVSSVVEHYLDTVGVTGSNPVSRTILDLRVPRDTQAAGCGSERSTHHGLVRVLVRASPSRLEAFSWRYSLTAWQWDEPSQLQGRFVVPED
jgi:hypothetical protein